MKKDKKMVELTGQIHKFMQQTVLALHLVEKRLGKMENILFALMGDLGKSETMNCPNCGKSITRPGIDGIAIEAECPSCAGNAIAENRITVENWDSSSI